MAVFNSYVTLPEGISHHVTTDGSVALCVPFSLLRKRFLRASWGMTCASNLLPTECVSNPLTFWLSFNLLICRAAVWPVACFKNVSGRHIFFDLRHDCRGGVELQRADSLTTNNAARALMQRCHLGVCKKAIDDYWWMLHIYTVPNCRENSRCLLYGWFAGCDVQQRRNNSEFDHSTEDLGIDLKPRSLISV